MIFDRVIPSFSYDRAQSDTAGVANHIYNALYKPQTTYPSKTGKVIPGDIWNGNSRPLHRNWGCWSSPPPRAALPQPPGKRPSTSAPSTSTT
ncbi:hypothetical protein ACFYO2_48900 [Streptomyces sp. NPDC006602]|uniref:hypothetical protein n=1 Tax=Streptomyces sp. NPDC006602 TaxID=3364751 RepID=UPI0036779A7A